MRVVLNGSHDDPRIRGLIGIYFESLGGGQEFLRENQLFAR